MQKILGSNPLDMYEIATGQNPQEDELAAINASSKLVEADDVTAVKVIGIIEGINGDGKAKVESGIVRMANSGSAPLARADRGSKCFVEDGLTVAKTGTVVAGTVIDVTAAGVFVDTSPVAMRAAIAPAAHIADVAAVTQDTLTDSSGGTPATTLASSILTGTLTGTVNGALVDIAAASGACAGDTTPSATNVNSAIATAVAPIVTGVNEQNKEMLTAIIALTNSVASLSAQLAKAKADNAAQVTTINAILARLEAAGINLSA